MASSGDNSTCNHKPDKEIEISISPCQSCKSNSCYSTACRDSNSAELNLQRNFQSGLHSIPGLAPTLIRQFQSPVKGTSCISFASDGTAWIGSKDSKTLIQINIDGQLISKRKISVDVRSLEVLGNGDIIVCPDSGKKVIKILKDDSEITLYKPKYVLKLFGATCTGDDEFLITNGCILVKRNQQGEDVIYNETIQRCFAPLTTALMDRDGTIYIGGIISESAQGLYIIEEQTNQKTFIFDFFGRINVQLNGIAIDIHENILLSDTKHHCIYLIDSKRHVKELVNSIRPRVIASDKEGNLWVVDKSEIVSVFKYLL